MFEVTVPTKTPTMKPVPESHPHPMAKTPTEAAQKVCPIIPDIEFCCSDECMGWVTDSVNPKLGTCVLLSSKLSNHSCCKG